MSSRTLVDPELLPALEAIPAFELSVSVLPALRAASLVSLVADPTTIDRVMVASRSVPGRHGDPDVGVVIYTPSQGNGRFPCILHIHGGGYVMGSAAGMEPLHRSLALAAECVIVSVDYRLAPETRYPGAVEDCYAALNWTWSNAETLSIDPDRVGVMGESAGGGLAAALALLCRDRGGDRRLAFQHLMYPMIDDRTCTGPDRHPYAGEFVWTASSNAFGWKSLLGIAPGSAEVSCYAAASRAKSVTGLPPTFIAAGGLDLFLEEDIEYARRLLRDAVPVELHVYPGAYHGFDVFAPHATVSQAANRDRLASLRRALHGSALRRPTGL